MRVKGPNQRLDHLLLLLWRQNPEPDKEQHYRAHAAERVDESGERVTDSGDARVSGPRAHLLPHGGDADSLSLAVLENALRALEEEALEMLAGATAAEDVE
jgi:hypothetical protein